MDNRLLAYLYCFNVTQNYYDCHEYLESLWLDSGRPAVQQGLIQAAVCLYHLYNGNVRGAKRMWGRGRPRLVAAAPAWQGINLQDLIQQMDDVFASIPAAWSDQTVAPQSIGALELPRVVIHFVDPALAGRVERVILPSLEDE